MKHQAAGRRRVLASRPSPLVVPASLPPPSKPTLPRSAWSRLAACTAAAALLQLDGTLITVALPSVANGLHVSTSSTSALLSAYFAAYALLLIPGGELVDRFGARRIALVGLTLFAVGAAAGALVPLTIVAGVAIARLMPAIVHADKGDNPALNRIVLAATLVAGLTFAVMIGAFYIAEQYLQRVAGFSALGASGALVLVALLVGAAAPMAGRLVDRHGEQVPALLGFGASALGLTVLGIPGMTLNGVITILPLIPVGLGLGMLFVPTSRAALNASPLASHGRTSALLSVGRLLGATVGAGLAGIAL